MKEFYWNTETIEYFKELYDLKPHRYYQEIEEFIKYDCDLEDGETREDLVADLISKTQSNEEY